MIDRSAGDGHRPGCTRPSYDAPAVPAVHPMAVRQGPLTAGRSTPAAWPASLPAVMLVACGLLALLCVACGTATEKRPIPLRPVAGQPAESKTAAAGTGGSKAPGPSSPGSPDQGEALRSWPAFPAIVWMFRGPELNAETLAVLGRLGLDAVNVEGSASSEEVRSTGTSFYVSHAVGKGDLGLRPETFEEALASGVDRPIRPNCFNDRQVLGGLLESLQASLESHQDPALLGMALDDEVSITRGITPADFCFGPECLESLRRWLRERYASLRILNELWGTSFADFSEVVPFTTTESFERNQGRFVAEIDFSSWSDHRRFMDASFAAVIQRLRSAVHEQDPGLPVGILGGQPPSAFGGYDWWRLARGLTFLEAYDRGGAIEVARSFAPPDCRFVETLSLEGAKPEVIAHELARRVARGDAGVILWAAKDLFKEGDLARPTPQARTLQSLLPGVRGLRARLPRLRRDSADVVIYESQPSIRAGWLVDASKEWKTWRNRRSSYEYEHSSSMLARAGWIELLEDIGVSYRFLASHEVMSGSLLRHPPAVLILPRALALSDREVRAFRRYVRAGGCLVADSHVGFFDENITGRTRPALDDLFGIRRDRLRQRLEDLDEVHTVPTTMGLPLGEGYVEAEGPSTWAYGIRRSHGTAGLSIYLNLDLRRYPDYRLAPETKTLRQRLFSVFESRGACPWPRLDAHGGSAYLGLVMYRYRTEHDRVVMISRRGPARDAEGTSPWGPRLMLRVTFREPHALEDLMTGKTRPPARRHDLVMLANGLLALRIIE